MPVPLRVLRCLLLLVGFLPAAATAQPVRNATEGDVFYHLFVRSFYDSNGDRIGDLKGIEQKLDYLQEMGVTGILMLPLYKSGFYHNYFPDDFEAIDPEFGSKQDYLDLVRAVHARGMKLLMDMEIHYVTGDHPWYRDSYGNPKSAYSDYILYHDSANVEPESGFLSMKEIPTYNGSTFKLVMLDLKNEQVAQYMRDLFTFWMDPNKDGRFDDGIDGFRLDHIMDDLDWKGIQTNLLSDFWKPLFDEARRVNPKVFFVGEQASWGFGEDIVTKGDADAVFAFPLHFALLKFDKKAIAEQADSTTLMLPAGKLPFVFIENHDTDRFASRVGDETGKLYVGAAMNLLFKGVPILYYGQELGMRGSKGNWGHDGNDIPMREAYEWTNRPDAPGMAIWYKDSGPWWMSSSLKADDGISVEEQADDETSLLNYYRDLIRIRKSSAALSSGDLRIVDNDRPDVLSFLRQSGEENVLVIMNLSGQTVSVHIDQTAGQAYELMLDGGSCPEANTPLELYPYQVSICRVGS